MLAIKDKQLIRFSASFDFDPIDFLDVIKLSLNFQVFFFILPETTPTALTKVLLDKINASNVVSFEPLEEIALQEESKNTVMNS